MKRLRYLVGCFAVGLLLSSCGEKNCPADEEILNDETEQGVGDSGKSALAHAKAIIAMGARCSGSPAYARQLDYLIKHLETLGWTCLFYSWKEHNPLTGNPVTMTNLYARWGKAFNEMSPPEGLLTCHIDTKSGIDGFVGADDGASGAAALLEIAKLLRETPQVAERIELVFFDGEESFAPHMTPQDGLYGSRFDVERRGEELPRWQINLDMVGGRDKVIAVPSDETSQEMYVQYKRAVEELGYAPSRWQVSFGSLFDDHLPFHEAGVDTLNLIAQFSGTTWWHTAADNEARLSARSFEETVSFVMQMLRQLSEKTPTSAF